MAGLFISGNRLCVYTFVSLLGAFALKVLFDLGPRDSRMGMIVFANEFKFVPLTMFASNSFSICDSRKLARAAEIYGPPRVYGQPNEAVRYISLGAQRRAKAEAARNELQLHTLGVQR